MLADASHKTSQWAQEDCLVQTAGTRRRGERRGRWRSTARASHPASQHWQTGCMARVNVPTFLNALGAGPECNPMMFRISLLAG